MKNLKDDTYGLSSLTASLYDGYEADLFAETCATGSADQDQGPVQRRRRHLHLG